jgi:hypothetical protein
MKRTFLILTAVCALGALAACETATPYQPIAKGNAQSGGYIEAKIEDNRWRVTFRGNSLTSRETVENYLLYRAAELTAAQGFDWFTTADRATDTHTDTYVTPDPWGYGYGWRPYWRFYGPGWRGRWGGPFWGDPWDGWGPAEVETSQSYETSAEIVMGHGAKPAGDRHAFDAHEVIANLGPHIVRPK